MELNQQTVLVTGASRGLGAAIAKAFGREKARVIVNYFTSEEKAQEVVTEIGCELAIAIRADVRNKNEVEDMFKQAERHFGRPITTIINNALITSVA